MTVVTCAVTCTVVTAGASHGAIIAMQISGVISNLPVWSGVCIRT